MKLHQLRETRSTATEVLEWLKKHAHELFPGGEDQSVIIEGEHLLDEDSGEILARSTPSGVEICFEMIVELPLPSGISVLEKQTVLDAPFSKLDWVPPKCQQIDIGPKVTTLKGLSKGLKEVEQIHLNHTSGSKLRTGLLELAMIRYHGLKIHGESGEMLYVTGGDAKKFKREDFKVGQKWKAKWHSLHDSCTIRKVRATGCQVEWKDGSSTYHLPFANFDSKIAEAPGSQPPRDGSDTDKIMDALIIISNHVKASDGHPNNILKLRKYLITMGYEEYL